MPPQTNTPNTQPQPAPQQPAPVQPQPNPAPASQQPAPVQPPSDPVAMGAMPSQPQVGNGGSKKGLIIGLIIGVVVFFGLVAAVLLWLFVFSPAAATKRVSNAFMSNLTVGNVDGALKYVSSPDDASTRAFITKAAESSTGSFSLSDGAMQNSKGYYLYELSNEAGKKGRTTIEKDGGAWKVTSYVFGSEDLALIPGESTGTASPSTTPAPEPTATKACLVNSDFKQVWTDIFGSSTPYDSTILFEKNGKTDNFHFNPRSTEFADYENTNKITAYAKFAKINQGKDFTIYIQGAIGSLNQADLDIADKRAQKIYDALVAKGAPESTLKVLESRTQEATGGGSNNIDDRRDRVVVMGIIPSTACGHPTGNLY